ncbi:bifunctional hydroxymethylpyrimidine kinase/phosphomethylpyrimidine kinase [Rhizobium sp. NRK18]|uniref:bifunctional hydroxymethylpyrimidine kinase/phosphomethylpyrimidine kinase n=1 Tax=Rhizobium sp. NRK18 TaxID=2964667 RepID=UPI0021C26017|nr:bifunctional hydroxymethylpyrimidine kinase/phosphomethylpyrimidine kinase [Rhizobium sp. NRK18]MCQ2005912.1 bifunctional hydroxymethylpyrimidine kinase/phosphomethylpyrimidine kinase [Rhizobium sp. NRK18]
MAVDTASRLLVIAGSDSSGGAGVVRDVETATAFGVKCSIAITAVTAQTHCEVRAVQPMPAPLVENQIRAAFSAGDIAAVKIGMLGTAEIVDAVANSLAGVENVPIVLDPVLFSTSGKPLLEPDAARLLVDRLLPLTALVTPNLPELEALADLLGLPVQLGATAMARALLAKGAAAVLVKGGHAEGPDAADMLVRLEGEPKIYASPRFPVAMRGTGCMLSTAIAAGLVHGQTLEAAVERAKAFLTDAFRAHAGEL